MAWGRQERRLGREDNNGAWEKYFRTLHRQANPVRVPVPPVEKPTQPTESKSEMGVVKRVLQVAAEVLRRITSRSQ